MTKEALSLPALKYGDSWANFIEKINADVIAHWKIKLRNKGYVVKPSTEIEWR